MTAEEKTMALALLASTLAQRMTEDQLVQAAALFTQLGTNLSFLASQRALDAVGQNATSSQVTSSGGRCSPKPTCQAAKETPPSPKSGPCPQNPGGPEGSLATGR